MFFNTNKSSSVLPRLATYIFELSIIISTVFVLPGQSATALEEIDENPGKKTRILCFIKLKKELYLLANNMIFQIHRGLFKSLKSILFFFNILYNYWNKNYIDS